MKIFKKEPDFRFMKKRFFAFGLSFIILIAGGIIYQTKGFNLGIDFTGGTMIEVSFKDQTNENDIRAKLKEINLGKSVIQRVGRGENKFFIKTVKSSEIVEEDKELGSLEKISAIVRSVLLTAEERQSLEAGKLDLNNISQKRINELLFSQGISEEDASMSAEKIAGFRDEKTTGLVTDISELENLDLKKRVKSVLEENTYFGGFTFLSVEIVGPEVGHDLRKKVTLATIWALIGMLIYIGFRFKLVYGIAAVITLLHDVLICLSFILFFNVEVSLLVVAALLTIVGYSLNDTIVIFDRVRDNVKLLRRENSETILDRSINQTLNRTIVTSGTTLTVVLSLFFLGGEVIHLFALTLIVGVIVGTYSSIFQSCAWLKIWEKSFLGRKKI